LGEIWQELQISQFSRDNNYIKNTPRAVYSGVGYWIAITSSP
jgi:hypothetical protein